MWKFIFGITVGVLAGVSLARGTLKTDVERAAKTAEKLLDAAKRIEGTRL